MGVICNCFDLYRSYTEDDLFDPSLRPKLRIHGERQDTSSEGWERLLELIDRAAGDGRPEFVPGMEIPWELRKSIIELPRSIGKLKAVKKLDLYQGMPFENGSHILRIPPEIGEMESLEKFFVYGSHGLHFVPYEITRCKNLKMTFVSTRALYGNFKNRPPFPSLPQLDVQEILPDSCSVCRAPIPVSGPLQRWISLRLVDHDVFPLLLNACSEDCIRRLPKPADGYVHSPHIGGNDLVQPTTPY